MNAYEQNGQLYFRDNNKFKVPVDKERQLLNPDLITRTTKAADMHYGTKVFPTLDEDGAAVGSQTLKCYLISLLVLGSIISYF